MPEQTFSSKEYWKRRYLPGGRAVGAGTEATHLFQFKVGVVNDIIADYNLRTAVDWGCGSGQVAARVRGLSQYLGWDVSSRAIQRARILCEGAPEKQFRVLGVDSIPPSTFSLGLSLDVIYHLVEDAVYEEYMQRLFAHASRAVLIYSSNGEPEGGPPASEAPPHVQHRVFTDWARDNAPAWTLACIMPNPFPFRGDAFNESFSNFFLYTRKNSAK